MHALLEKVLSTLVESIISMIDGWKIEEQTSYNWKYVPPLRTFMSR